MTRAEKIEAILENMNEFQGPIDDGELERFKKELEQKSDGEIDEELDFQYYLWYK